MIDVHNHILYGIDDGCKTKEESLSVLEKMSNLGYEKIVVTPHYMEEANYTANHEEKMKLLKELEAELKLKHIPLKLYLGQEIYIQESIEEKIKMKQISTINNQKVLLVEIPMFEKICEALDFLDELIFQGYKIILAHPERYLIFQENPTLIQDYLSKGIFLQGNMESINGKYGKKAQKLSKFLLKNKMYFVLASDVHHENASFFEDFYKIKKKLLKVINEDYFKDLLFINPEKMLKDIFEK